MGRFDSRPRVHEGNHHERSGAHPRRRRAGYTLASVVDDGELSATHVIRGEDHVSNTAVQIQLYKALGFAIPAFAHMALLKTKEGEMSKRLGGNDIRSLRDAGILPMALNSLLARMGTSESVEVFADMEPLIDSFDSKNSAARPLITMWRSLKNSMKNCCTQLPFSTVKEKLPFADEPFWLSVRTNIKNLGEAKDWWNILHGDVQADLNHDEREFLRATVHHLPLAPWNETTYDAWITAVKPTTQRKGKELFLPLRRALTGQDHGPELKKLLPLLGIEKTKSRLAA